MIRHLIRIAPPFLAASLALAGCVGVKDPTTYYLLSPTSTSPGGPARPAAVSTADIAVGVGPVLLPRYLDRVQIVTRNANDEVEISTYRRWAEPLESGIAQVLADNLAKQIGTERVVVFPWRGPLTRALEYRVVVDVLRFDGAPGGQVVLDARWRLLDKDGKELGLRRTTISDAVAGESYQTLVAGMNRLLAGLAAEIAVEIRSHANIRAAGS